MKITVPETIPHLTSEVLDIIVNNKEITREDLDEIHIPGSVKKIGELAFEDCHNLKRVTLEEGLQSIGNYAFIRTAIEAIIIPGSVKSIGDTTFKWCRKLKRVRLEEGVEYIGHHVFANTAIEAITIPGSVKTIGNYAFDECKNLKHVTLEEGLQSIGKAAFTETAIEAITIPRSIKTIGENALKCCLRLEVVILPVAHAKRGSYSETLGVMSKVHVIVSDDLNQTVQETLNTYNSEITAKENRLTLQNMSQYSTQQLYTIWHLLTNKQTITNEQECLMVKRVLSMSCDDALNIAKQFPSIMNFSLQLKNSQKNEESLRSKMGNVLGRNKQVLDVCWGLINDLHIKHASLAWISPFLTLKEVARVILTMLSCKHGQAQIINSRDGQMVAAISIGVGDINASMDQETESASNNLVTSMGGGGVVQTEQENLDNTKLDEAAIVDGKGLLC